MTKTTCQKRVDEELNEELATIAIGAGALAALAGIRLITFLIQDAKERKFLNSFPVDENLTVGQALKLIKKVGSKEDKDKAEKYANRLSFAIYTLTNDGTFGSNFVRKVEQIRRPYNEEEKNAAKQLFKLYKKYSEAN